MINTHLSQAPASIDDIKLSLNPLSERAALDIRRIGPTLSEIKEVQTFMEAYDSIPEALENIMTFRSRRVYSILKRACRKPCCCN